MESKNCPQCGAPSTKAVCEFCGAKVRDVSTTESLQSGFNAVKASISGTAADHPEEDGTLVFLLALFLGIFGAHKFYAGDMRKGIIYLLCFWVGSFLIIPPLVVIVLILLDAWKIAKGEAYNFARTKHYTPQGWMKIIFYVIGAILVLTTIMAVFGIAGAILGYV